MPSLVSGLLSQLAEGGKAAFLTGLLTFHRLLSIPPVATLSLRRRSASAPLQLLPGELLQARQFRGPGLLRQ